MRITKIVSGFPAIGKSYLVENVKEFNMLDSDSNNFSWLEEGVRDPDFPQNYMEHIKSKLGEVDYIFVSSHDVVRRALEENSIDYTLIYPDISLKDEYIERLKARGDGENFIDFISENWDGFISGIEEETFPALMKLGSGAYLFDAMVVDMSKRYEYYSSQNGQ